MTAKEEVSVLLKKINGLKAELMYFKLQVKLGNEERFHKIKIFRREIARLVAKLDGLRAGS